MTGSALVNVFNLSMRAVFGLNLSANVGVTGNAEGILSGLQRLVAAAALAFELGVGSKAFQRRLLAAEVAQPSGAESLAPRTPGGQTQGDQENRCRRVAEE